MVALGTLDAAESAISMKEVWGYDPCYLETYRSHYKKLSPLIPIARDAQVGAAVSVSDSTPYDEFRKSIFFREWARPQGLVDAILVNLDRTATAGTFLVGVRTERTGTVDEEMRRRIRLLWPHFRRAVLIRKAIEQRKLDAATLAETADALAVAILLVDAGAHVVRANASGQALLEERRVVEHRGGRLAAIDPRADRALRGALAAAPGGDAAVGGKGIAVPLGRGEGARWIAHVLPLTSGVRRRFGAEHSATATVFVRKVAFELPYALESIVAIYKLTPAESRVLMAIIELGGVSKVASELGISETTVKTHLQHVFDKTCTKRQVDLVKLVAAHRSPFC
jgi:DNA-binding CsgD family transcriptional regulator